MGLLDFLFGKKDTGSIDEQLKKEASMQHQEAINNENVNGEFLMTVEDVFVISGRGTVITGRITSGKIGINESVVSRTSGQRYMVAGIEMFRKSLDYAQAGDNVGLLLRDANRDSISKGDILTK